jgi:hypothetical protein
VLAHVAGIPVEEALLAAPNPITLPVMVIEPSVPLDELNEMPE